LFSRVRETYREKNGLIVLMHDAPGKETTADALPEIIQFLRKKGYRFELLPGSR
jgi:peptidoglycan/xylan/chitin deacetylase (PgdA/CDA1 family)